jgi:hypothetical protein
VRAAGHVMRRSVGRRRMKPMHRRDGEPY